MKIMVVLFSTFGIIVLYLYSLSIEPAHVSISDLNGHVGEYVVVRGYVIDVWEGRSSTSFLLSENSSNATVMVFLDSKERIEPGYMVELMGMVEEYHGGYSITLQGRGYFHILKKWESRLLTLPALSQGPWNYLGQNLNISCIKGQRYNSGDSSYFIVKARYGNYTMRVYIQDLTVSDYPENTYIFLNARLEYSYTSFRFYLVMDSPQHHIWYDEIGNLEG